MKVFACALALCLLVSVYAQTNPATGGASSGNALAAAAAAAAASGRPMVGGAGMGGGLAQLMTLGALSGGIGNDAFMRYSMCNMLTGGANNFLCLSSMMQ